MPTWWIWAAAVAIANLAVLVAVRGRWTRRTGWLALASLVGTLGGNAVAGRTGLEVLTIGGFHLVAASVGAQAAMWVVILGSAALPARRPRHAGPTEPPSDEGEPDR